MTNPKHLAVRKHLDNIPAATPIKCDTSPALLKEGVSKPALIIALLANIACVFVSTFAAEKTTLRDPQLRRLYHSLRQPVIADSSFMISDTLRLDYPDFTVTIQRGELVPLRDSTATLTGFYFEGAAQVRFRPRYEMERQQLHRFTGDSVTVREAARLLVRVSRPNALPQAIRASAAFHPTKTKGGHEAHELNKTMQEALLERRGYNLAAQLMSRRLSEDTDTLFVCAFHPARDRELFPPMQLYVYDGLALEQVGYFQYAQKSLGKPFYTVCSYPLSRERFSQIPATLRIKKYNGWVKVEESGKINADLGFDFYTAQYRPPALSFTLSSELKVTRISAETGDTLAFVQEAKEAGVTVFLTPRMWMSDTLRLFFQYEGEALRRHENGSLFLKDAVNWVPRWGYLARAQYHLIFKCPPRMRVLSIGELVRDWDEPGHHLSFYKTRVPAKAATFCLGNFSADTMATAHTNLPRIEIHSTPRRSARDRRRVACDIANSLHFYERMLAPYPLQNIRVVEAPTTHSQGFPGFVTLSWVGFASHVQGPLEALRSHEVAHQWFGNKIGWATYHDQWLSEAFAEYLGALYVEWIAEDPMSFAQLLEAWRDDILEGGHIGVSLGMQRFGLGKSALRNTEGMKAGPLWLGFRLGQKEVLDYYMQVYEKGAYVLHMLRWLLRDLETGSDAAFWNMLADFLNEYNEREPSTEDFQRVAERHYGEPLDWFFRQWIFRTEAPAYRWSYALVSAPATQPLGLPIAKGGMESSMQKQVLRLQVQQEGVSADFMMPVPIRIEYVDGVRELHRVPVQQNSPPFEIPLRPVAVKEVEFNTGHAVLARQSRHEK